MPIGPMETPLLDPVRLVAPQPLFPIPTSLSAMPTYKPSLVPGGRFPNPEMHAPPTLAGLADLYVLDLLTPPFDRPEPHIQSWSLLSSYGDNTSTQASPSAISDSQASGSTGTGLEIPVR
ncbi:hypothetical protein FRC11_008314, partial [Ceratobasidium sp. 423]